jgi:hypothetical protein
MNAKDKKQKLAIAESLRGAANQYSRRALTPDAVRMQINAELKKHALTDENEMFFAYILGEIEQWSGIPAYSSASLWNVLIDIDVDDC